MHCPFVAFPNKKEERGCGVCNLREVAMGGMYTWVPEVHKFGFYPQEQL